MWVAILGVNPDDSKLPDELGVNDSTVALLAVAFLVAVVAPIAEEFFFRGFFFGALRNWKGPLPAAILTGLVFGAIHVGSAEAAFLLPLAFFGFTLCLLRERTGSLYPGIALHCVNNSLAFGVSQHWGWQILVLLVCALGDHLARRARGPRDVDARARARRLSGQRPIFGRTACIGTFPRHAQTVRSAPRLHPHGRAERRLRGHRAAAVAHARARDQRSTSRWPASRGACASSCSPGSRARPRPCASTVTATSCAWSTST